MRSIAIVWLFSVSFGVLGYEESTHERLTDVAIKRSALLTDPSLLSDLGVAGVDSGSFPAYQGLLLNQLGERTPLDVAKWGASEEDNVYNGVYWNHFFDPQWNNGVGRALTVVPVLGEGVTSPDWILETRYSYAKQSFSFNKAQSQLLSALTGVNPTTRKWAFGMVFHSLGHIAHHIQDMAQPQHVRNEPHIHGKSTFIQMANGRYEIYTEDELNGTLIEKANSVWPQYPIPKFDAVTKYWSSYNNTSYLGMAEFTARNFVTYNTGFVYDPTVPAVGFRPWSSFPLPDGRNPNGTLNTIETVQVSVPSLSRRGEMVTASRSYAIGTIRDDFTGVNLGGRRIAASSALLRVGLAPTAPRSRFFTGGDPEVWEAQYPILLPRAIAFSAGVINHFFRARVGLSRVSGTTWRLSNPTEYPMSGVYSIYTENAAGTRSPVSGAAVSTTISANGSTTLTIPEPATGTAKLIAVFSGTVGKETNRVAGQVISYAPPAIPCGTPVSAEGGSKGYTKTMDLGSVTGAVQVQFEAYAIPDALEIKRGSTVVATTRGAVSGLQKFSFPQDSGAGRYLDVKVTGNTDTNTQWTLAVSCPGDAPLAPRPTVQVGFGTDKGELCAVGGYPGCTKLEVCGLYSIKVNSQSSANSGTWLPLTAGTNILMEVSHSNPYCGASGTSLPTKNPGLPFYSDTAGKHPLQSGANWVVVK